MKQMLAFAEKDPKFQSFHKNTRGTVKKLGNFFSFGGEFQVVNLEFFRFFIPHPTGEVNWQICPGEWDLSLDPPLL